MWVDWCEMFECCCRHVYNTVLGVFFAEWYDFVAVDNNVQHHKLIISSRVLCYISYYYRISVDLSKLPEDQTAGAQGKKGIYLL